MYSLTIEMTVGNNKVRFQTFHHQNFQIKISVEFSLRITLSHDSQSECMKVRYSSHKCLRFHKILLMAG